MQPSVSSRSKVVCTAPQRAVELPGAQIGIGGEHDQHRGERSGCQHGRALGHAATV
jgi:hypothetical protein